MSSTHRYVTGMFLAAAIILFGGLFLLRGASKRVYQAEFDMSYSMPRPKSALYNFFFGLEGREIDRTIINPFKDKKKKDSKGNDASVRKETPKVAAAPKAPVPAPKPAVKPIEAPRKPEVSINVTNTDTSGDSTSGSGPATNPTSNVVNARISNGPASGAGATTEAKPDLLSVGQWRALMQAQPTKENVNKLVTAFNNKEADASTLYLVMNDLMQSSNSDTQRLGILIGQSVPSLRSFSATAENYERFDNTVKQEADAYMLTYMQNSRLSIMALALQSETTQVVYHAAKTMVAGLEKVKSTPNDNSRNNASRGVVATGKKNVYAPFVTILEKLAASGDSSVAGLAQNALTQIQALSNT